jgi:YebC/PmpR family DNA-binding regulatory protein
VAGHSKWANIKHRKAAQDAKKGKIFTKVAKEITVAAKLGGGDPEMNPRLRLALDKAKSVNLPKDNVERAIKKGTGEGNEANFEDVIYEGYGPGGVAILVQALTDNKNRTVSEVRSTMSKNGGNMGEAGCVSWIFDKKGVISIPLNYVDEETIMSLAIEAGAEDVETGEEYYEIVCDPADYENVKKTIEKSKIEYEYAEITMRPKNTVEVEGDTAKKVINLLEALEDLDDIQEVYSNFDMVDITPEGT